MNVIGGKGDKNKWGFNVKPNKLEGGGETSPKLAQLEALHKGRAISEASRNVQENIFIAKILETKALAVNLGNLLGDHMENFNQVHEHVLNQLMLLSTYLLASHSGDVGGNILLIEQLQDKIKDGVKKTRELISYLQRRSTPKGDQRSEEGVKGKGK